MKYSPPYEITNNMFERISFIMKKIGMLDNYKSFNKKPILRKNNRIRSVYSSLAIEANSLSLTEVWDVIDGKAVLGNKKEIEEVKNAYRAYQNMNLFRPYDLNDLKKAHGFDAIFIT